MKEIFTNLRGRFVIICVLISGIFLFALLSTVYVVLTVNSNNRIEATLDEALNRPFISGDPFGTNPESNKCIKIILKNNVIYQTSQLDFYDDSDVEQILIKAVETGEGKFSVNNLYFQVQSKSYLDFIEFAVYDRTQDRNSLKNVGIVMVIAYSSSLIVIAGLAFLLSKNALNPVKEAFYKQRELIANASHELKTPLTIIATDLSVVESEKQSTVEENEKWLESISTQVDRMRGLIVDMLELCKLEQSEAKIEESVNFSEIVSASILQVEALCYEKGLKLTANVDNDIILKGIKNSLERLLLILLDNAIKYTQVNGEITVKLYKSKNNATLTVENTGKGLTKEEISKVFDRFYKGDQARTQDKVNSFGLGLSIASAIVKNHRGSINCVSQENVSTVFSVVLPL